jgi:hypothetical protein
MAAIDIAGMKTAFGIKDEDLQGPAEKESRVPNVSAMQSYFETVPPAKSTTQKAAEKYFGNIAAYQDVLASALTGPAAVTGYLTRRAMGETPEEAEATVQSYMKPLMSPMGSLGYEKTEAYQQSFPQRAMRAIGEYTAPAMQALETATGIPQQDIANVAGAAGIFAPVVPKIAPAMRQVGAAAEEATRAMRPIQAPTLTPQQAMEQFRARGGQAPFMGEAQPPVQPAETMRLIGGPEVPVQPTTPTGAAVPLTAGQAAPEAPAPAPGAAAGPSAGAAAVEQRPYTLTGEETARGTFPQVKLFKIGEPVPISEQQLRAQIVNDIMQGKGGVRTGVITGDDNILRNEYERAALTDKEGKRTPEAETLRAQIAAEQNALSDYAQQRVLSTQADPLLRDDYARGQRINDAVYGENGLYGEIRRQKNAIYEEARQVVGDNPVDTPNINKLLNSRQFQGSIKAAGQKDFTSGLEDLLDLHRTEGFEGTQPNSIASLEGLRQAANALRTPDNSRFVGKVIQAIDDDIASAGGPGLYQRGRQVHAAEMQLFEPAAMQKIFGRVLDSGIKEGIPLEKMVTQMNRLSFDEWAHIHDTFETLARGEMPGNLQGLTVSPELQAYAQSALSEMKGAIARDIYEAGASKAGEWNTNAANKAMNFYARKIEYAFDPAEVVAFHNLNYGGQMMPPLGYEGAGRQIRRIETVDTVSEMAQKGAKAVEAGAAAIGKPTFGIPTRAAEMIKESRSAAEQTRRAEMTQRELQRNMQLPGMTLEEISNLGKVDKYGEIRRR